MARRRSFLRLSVLGIVAALGTLALPEFASAQYGAWRGGTRTMTRDGLFHVTRSHTHWGNGITPTGGAVLVHLIDAAPGIIDASLGRGTDRQMSTRGTREPWAGWDAYREEQKRATDLLARLANMSPGSIQTGPAPTVIPTLDPRTYLQSDPWEGVQVDQ